MALRDRFPELARWYREYYRAGDPPQYAHREKELEVMDAWLAARGRARPEAV